MTKSARQIVRAAAHHPLVNGWGLFALIVVPMLSVTMIAFMRIDSGDAAQISQMIQLTVRLAVPWLFVAFAASSLVTLAPNPFTAWIARNRRIFGLCFAAGMAAQLFFILWLVFGFFGYYMAQAYSPYDLAEQIPGYIVLSAMTVTSFRFGRQWLTAKQWRILHKGGIYFLWGVVWSTYWFELYYYNDIQFIDYVYYWLGFAAWGVRIGAWCKKRAADRRKSVPVSA